MGRSCDALHAEAVQLGRCRRWQGQSRQDRVQDSCRKAFDSGISPPCWWRCTRPQHAAVRVRLTTESRGDRGRAGSRRAGDYRQLPALRRRQALRRDRVLPGDELDWGKPPTASSRPAPIRPQARPPADRARADRATGILHKAGEVSMARHARSRRRLLDTACCRILLHLGAIPCQATRRPRQTAAFGRVSRGWTWCAGSSSSVSAATGDGLAEGPDARS